VSRNVADYVDTSLLAELDKGDFLAILKRKYGR